MMTIYAQDALARLSPEERARLFATYLSLGAQPDTGAEVLLDDRDRFAGMYVLGVQGVGKSGLLETLIQQDVQKGNAVVVLDPHGDLIDHCVAQLPPDRLKNTYLLDMEDEDFPFGVNVFAAGKLDTSIKQAQAIERVLHIFEVLWEGVLNQQGLPRYLRMAIIVLLANPGATLVDMYEFLLDASVRQRLLQHVSDPTVRAFWQTQYDNLRNDDARMQKVGPLLTRLESLFAGRSLVRNIVGQRRTSIHFRRAIEERALIFIKLPTKTIAQDAELIGTILLSQLYAAVFSFADIPDHERPGVSVYVDEFQHFATPDFASLFSEGRKFGVRLTLAHQYRGQLPTYLQESTRTARTKAVFRITAEDGREMAHYFPDIGPGKLEAVEAHPVAYLLDHVWQDHHMRVFIDTYLRPLKRQIHSSKVEIEHPGIDWKALAWHGALKYKEAMKGHETVVDDPTQYLDALLREVMEATNPKLAIPLKAVLGFSNCGKGFYAEARKAANTPLLNGGFAYPTNLAYNNRWVKVPTNSSEQLYHFIFHLRRVMAYLAEHPIGKRENVTATVVAQQLTGLPQRTAYVNVGGEVTLITTHDTPPRLTGAELERRMFTIREQTRAKYCHPKAEVEGRQPEPPLDIPAEGEIHLRQPVATAPLREHSRWEDL